MAGRSYRITDGRKELVPTERQLAKMARQSLENTYMDMGNRTGLKFTQEEIAKARLTVMMMTPEQIKETLNRGEATDAFIALKTLEFVDGKGKGQQDDPSFKFNEARVVSWMKDANMDKEVLFVWDKDGRFWGWTQGSEKSCSAKIPKGGLVGGTSLHNHPSTDKRPYGQSFSKGDILAGRYSAERRWIVAAKEGVYVVEMPPNAKYRDFDAMVFQAKTRAAWRSINQKLPQFKLNQAAKAQVHHTYMKEFASRQGLKYKFIPSKGYETLYND
jgi:ribosomal protein L20A (L18A)